ncbi:MAG: para-aminobenzoate synthetase component [Cryptosporangiaceae bacterium]|nr:para-aminobenzoate synthetase component [Cryptosporangiaceae bacterium]
MGDPGDPAALLEAFLSAEGLPAGDLHGMENEPGTGTVTGASPFASLLISAAAGAVIATSRCSTPPGVDGIPDVVAVVFDPRAGTSEPIRQPTLPPSLSVGEWNSSWSAGEHAAAVESVRDAIARGDVYQVNVVGHQSASFTGDPGPALRAVAGLPGAEYGAVLSGDGWSVATGSPECLVSVSGGIVETRPIKGTRPRTARGRAELYASAKERAEHVMIVDLERNDLARVAETGSVEVTELFTLRPWCDLWQAESVVRGRLRPGVGLAELLRAVCPGGSVTGAPKRSALEVIAGLEPVGRGPSMGALGWLGPNGLDLGLTIRTVAASAGRLHLWAGGGITWGSDPAAEVAEAAAKALPVRRAIAGAAAIPWPVTP